MGIGDWGIGNSLDISDQDGRTTIFLNRNLFYNERDTQDLTAENKKTSFITDKVDFTDFTDLVRNNC